MPVLEILRYPDPRLKRKSAPVSEITPSHLELLDDMIETMYKAKGVGLAAPQVGVNERLVVIDVHPREEGEVRKHGDPEVIELINPEIIESKGEVVAEEGCLSVPGFSSEVKRRASVTVRGLNRYGDELEFEASELLARAVQHEVDHLDGLLFFDRLSRLKRELFKKHIDRVLVD